MKIPFLTMASCKIYQRKDQFERIKLKFNFLPVFTLKWMKNCRHYTPWLEYEISVCQWLFCSYYTEFRRERERERERILKQKYEKEQIQVQIQLLKIFFFGINNVFSLKKYSFFWNIIMIFSDIFNEKTLMIGTGQIHVHNLVSWRKNSL
jgi:hypothetical protein